MFAGAAIGAVGSVIGSSIGDAVGAMVRRGFTPGGGSSNPAPQPVPIAAQALRGATRLETTACELATTSS